MKMHLTPPLLKDWFASAPVGSTVPADRTILLMDGGVSTHLERLLGEQGDTGTFPDRELWSSSLLRSQNGRETILRGHEDWLAAGSDILTTVTYQCHHGTGRTRECVVGETEMQQMIEHGIELAGRAVEEAYEKTKKGEDCTDALGVSPSFVVASSGCYGAALADGSEYTGNYGSIGLKGLEDFHRRKVESFLLAASSKNQKDHRRLDGIAIETVPSLLECEAACNVVLEASSQSSTSSNDHASTVAFWISLACRDGTSLNEGTDIQHALDVIRRQDPTGQHIHAVGINCCDSAHIGALLQMIARDMATKGPRRGIVVYPNSGEEWDAEQKRWLEGTGCTGEDQFAGNCSRCVGKARPCQHAAA